MAKYNKKEIEIEGINTNLKHLFYHINNAFSKGGRKGISLTKNVVLDSLELPNIRFFASLTQDGNYYFQNVI